MIAIISDIHGNYPALMSVLGKIDELACDKIYSLGDVAGYYCMINECIDELRSRNIDNIMGNHDEYLVTNTRCPRSKSANECLALQRTLISDSNMEWLAHSPATLRHGDISMVHGGWNDFTDEYLYEVSEAYLAPLDGSIFLSGHTHIQTLKAFSKKTYCNPGSVGQPRDGDPRAAFAVIEDGEIETLRVPYDIDVIADAMKKNGFSDYYVDNLYRGLRIGE